MRAPDSAAVAHISRVKSAARSRLMAIPGVHGLGVGYKYRGGHSTDDLAIRVHLPKKRSLEELDPQEVIPTEIDGVKTDVWESEIPEYCADNRRIRPLRGGTMIGWTETIVEHPSPNTTTIIRKPRRGTLGCMATARRTGKEVFLTNAHVVAGCEASDLQAAIGRRIGQPDDENDYTCCSKSWATVAGTVIAAKRDPVDPKVDVALVELDKCVDGEPKVEGIGSPITGHLTTSELNSLETQTVQFRGHRTEVVQEGIVHDVDLDSSVLCRQEEDGPATIHHFEQAIVVQSNPPGSPLAQRGDSGAVVLKNGKVVGLLFGIGSVEGVPSAYVCRIDNILATFETELDLEILTNPGFASPLSPSSSVASFAIAPEAARPGETFEPTSEELEILRRERDRLLATPGGQHLQRVISQHVQEIRNLINMEKRVAVTWRRLAAPALLRAAVHAVRSPDTPIADLVEVQPLNERVATFIRILTQYGSDRLVEDVTELYSLVERFSSASYGELTAWLQSTPTEAT